MKKNGVNFDKILKKSGVEDRPLYNLRHTLIDKFMIKIESSSDKDSDK